MPGVSSEEPARAQISPFGGRQRRRGKGQALSGTDLADVDGRQPILRGRAESDTAVSLPEGFHVRGDADRQLCPARGSKMVLRTSRLWVSTSYEFFHSFVEQALALVECPVPGALDEPQPRVREKLGRSSEERLREEIVLGTPDDQGRDP